jgi:hypothetical protein
MVRQTLFGLYLFSATLNAAQASDKTFVPEDAAKLSTINIQGSEQNTPKISTKKLLKVPGAGGDPLKAIEALPGVVLGGFGPFSIPAIRGSSPDDNIFITDFVPVGYVFHNDGFSTYNENLVEDFQLKAGAWGPRYNNAMGSVMNTTLRDPYREDIRSTVDLSLFRAGGMIEGALGDDSAFYASYRESLLQFYVENFVDEDELSFTEVPKNSDYQLKYHWQVNDSSNLRLMATGARDSVGIEFGPESKDLQHEPDLAGGLDANTFYHNQAMMYDTILAGGTSTKIALSRIENDQSFSVGSLIDVKATGLEYRLKNHYQTPLQNGDNLYYGYDSNSTQIKYNVTGKDVPCSDEFETCQPASLGLDFTTLDDITVNSTYVFTNYEWLATPFLDVSLGVGSSYNDFTQDATFEPRISSRYELNPQWRLNAAVGRHDQFHSDIRYIDKEVGTPDLKTPTSDHYVLGFEYTQGRSLSAKLESYYKQINDLVISNPAYDKINNPDIDRYLNEVSGEAYGLELLINKNLTDKWYGWLSVAYSKTKRTNDLTDTSFNYELDRPWIVNLVASYQYSPKTTIGWKWRYQSGALITPISGSNPVYQCVGVEGINFVNDSTLASCTGDGGTIPDTDGVKDVHLYEPINGAINSKRLPASHRLDFRIDYESTADATYYFEIVNLYNQQNVSGYDYDEKYETKEDVVSLPTLFNFGMKLTF